MKHTVIISSYNRHRMLREALASVFANKNADIETFVCDDGSDPMVRESINDFDVQWIDFGDIRCSFIFRFPIGINMALERCTGDVIHYLPDDDLFMPDRFLTAERLLDTDKMVGYGKQLYINNRDYMINISHMRFPLNDISPQNPHPVTGLLDHSQVFHKRECIDEWIVNNEAPDAKFFHKLSKAYKFHPTDQYVCIKRIHEYNMLRDLKSKSGKRERDT